MPNGQSRRCVRARSATGDFDDVFDWLGNEIGPGHENIFQLNRRRAGRVERQQRHRRLNGHAGCRHLQSDEQLSPVVHCSPGDDNVCAVRSRDPRNISVEQKSVCRFFCPDGRLFPVLTRGREVRDPDRCKN